MNVNDLLQRDEAFRYMMLERMRMDCEYYLGYGNRYPNYLWAKNEVEHIAYMKALWNSFPADGKPEWLSYEKILEYEKEMSPKAVLVERDYKGEYERFALTPKEFEREYKAFMHGEGGTVFGGKWESFTVQPLVHISALDVTVGDDSWQRFFTDMSWGLSEGDLKDGNLAYVCADKMPSLKQYLPEESLPEKKPTLDHQIQSAQQTAVAGDRHNPAKEAER